MLWEVALWNAEPVQVSRSEVEPGVPAPTAGFSAFSFNPALKFKDLPRKIIEAVPAFLLTLVTFYESQDSDLKRNSKFGRTY